MKKNYLILLAIVLSVYSTPWAQVPTSYGGLNQGNAGSGGGTTNSYFGHLSGSSNTGFFNTFIGYRSGFQNTTASGNIFIGTNSGFNNTSGNNNTFIGRNSGYNNQTGSGNIFLGYSAGINETGSNLLYIDNSNTPSPLIWGDFANDILGFNGNVGIGTTEATAALHITSTNYDGTPNVTGTQILGGGIEITRDGSNPWIDFQNDALGTNYDARIILDGDDQLGIYGADIDSNDGTYFLRNSANNTYGIGYNTEGGTEMTIFSDGIIDFTESDNENIVMQMDLNNGEVGIGTTSPTATLHVNGSVRLENISQNDGLDQVLVSDASGNINWRDAATLAGSGTDDQDLSIIVAGTNRTINITDGMGVNFSVADNDDDATNEHNTLFQVNAGNLEITDNGGTLSVPIASLGDGVNDADADPANEIQTLNYDNITQQLSISGGNNVDLSSLAGGGGTPHDFPSYPDSAGEGGTTTNSYFGHQAGINNTAEQNTFIGRRTGYENTTGFANTFVGNASGYYNETGAGNTFIGNASGHHGGGFNNTFIGESSGFSHDSGNFNTFIGSNSGHENETGEGNVFIGYGAGSNELGSDLLYIDNSSTPSPLIWGNFDNGNEELRFNGIVTIGNGQTPVAGYHLTVGGDIIAEKVKVAVNGSANWSDYVFEDDYNLIPLSEVEKYVKENKHLPNIPSAEEMVKEGLDVAEMDAKLLEKIEELTLYVIEINKKVEKLEAENAKLKSATTNPKQ